MSEMNSFQDAFYIIAKELGFDYAQPFSPREVFEQQMLPRIRELVATQPATDEPEHELIGYMAPVALMDLLHGGDTTAIIRSAIPSLTQPTPTPPEDWAVPIYVMRRQGEQQ